MALTFVKIRKKISKNGSFILDVGRTVKIWRTLIIRSDFSKDDLAPPFCISRISLPRCRNDATDWFRSVSDVSTTKHKYIRKIIFFTIFFGIFQFYYFSSFLYFHYFHLFFKLHCNSNCVLSVRSEIIFLFLNIKYN